MTSSGLPAELTLFPRMLGRWSGSMVDFDADGQVMSRATIDVDARFEGGQWRQLNTVTPEQGEARRSLVTGHFDRQARFHLDTDRVTGTGGEVAGCVVVAWSLKADPTKTFSELISFHGAAARTRTWHKFDGEAFAGYTLLRERRLG